jgi:hypothetical protein
MKNPSLDHMRSLAGHWEQCTALYDRINEPLFERYKKRLKDRFHPRILDGGDRSQGD